MHLPQKRVLSSLFIRLYSQVITIFSGRSSNILLENAIDLYLKNLTENDFSMTTVDSYRSCLATIAKNIGNIPISAITPERVKNCLDQKKSVIGPYKYADATMNKNISIVRSFFTWLSNNSFIKENPSTDLRSRKDRTKKKRDLSIKRILTVFLIRYGTLMIQTKSGMNYFSHYTPALEFGVRNALSLK